MPANSINRKCTFTAFSGHGMNSVQYPDTYDACYVMLIANAFLPNEYIAYSNPAREVETVIKIVAVEDDTRVVFDAGSTVGWFKKAGTKITYVLDANTTMVFWSPKPFLAYQITSSRTSLGMSGDPSMSYLMSPSFFVDAASVIIPVSKNISGFITENGIFIFVNTSYICHVMVDGNPIYNGYTWIMTDLANYSYTRIPVENGLHRTTTSRDVTFGVMLHGMGGIVEYSTLGGVGSSGTKKVIYIYFQIPTCHFYKFEEGGYVFFEVIVEKTKNNAK